MSFKSLSLSLSLLLSLPADIFRQRSASRGLTAADLFRLWRVSYTVADSSGLRGLYRRLSFMAAAVRHRAMLLPLLHANGGFERVLARRPETIGVLVWPYVCLSWDASTRLARIGDHWAAVEALAPALNFPPDDEYALLDLADVMPGLRVVLDQPKWLMREGQAVLNLFVDETRVFSLVFSLRMEDTLTACIGAIQGRSIEGARDTYKAMTHALHGMRPRDFLIDLFRALCRAIGVSRIYAIADTKRHHRSPYFGNKFAEQVTMDYDEIWRDRGGEPLNVDFFVLPVDATQRNVEEIPSKKRSMYRKRYEMLAQTDAALSRALLSAGGLNARSKPVER